MKSSAIRSRPIAPERTKPVFGWRKLRPFLKDDGAETVEFAICASVFITLLVGFLELCMVLFMANSVAEASRQAARWASVRGTTSSVTNNGVTKCANPNVTTCPAQTSDIQSYTQKLTGMSAATVSVNWCKSDGTSCSTSQSSATPGNIVKVKVSYKFTSVPFVSTAAITLNSTAEKIIWQ